MNMSGEARKFPYADISVWIPVSTVLALHTPVIALLTKRAWVFEWLKIGIGVSILLFWSSKLP